jgi:uncharacterized RDD family membrane protein YckC
MIHDSRHKRRMDTSPYEPPKAEIGTTPGGRNLASPWIRLGAAIIDGIVLWPINFILQKIFIKTPDVAEMMAKAAKGQAVNVADYLPGTGTLLFIQILGFAAFVGVNFVFLKKGQTIGKLALKLQVQRRSDGTLLPIQELILKRILPIWGASVLGLVFHPVLFLILTVDALCIFRPQRNTLHDDIAGTKVVTLGA